MQQFLKLSNVDFFHLEGQYDVSTTPPSTGGPTDYDRLQNEVERQVREADNFITDTRSNFIVNMNKLIDALLSAAREYDRIMAGQARKDIFGDILLNLLITFVPVAGVAQRAANITEKSVKIWQKSIKTVEDKLDDVINSVRGPLESRSSSDDTPQNQQAQEANNLIRETLQGMYDTADLMRILSSTARQYVAVRREGMLTGKISTSKNILDELKILYKSIGFHNSEPFATNFTDLQNQMLYNLLKNYAKQYMKISLGEDPNATGGTFKPELIAVYNFNNGFGSDVTLQYDSDKRALESKRIALLPQYRREPLVVGMNDGQRKLVYKKFGVASTNPKFPRINSYVDMIKYWGVQTTQYNQPFTWVDATPV